MSYSFDFNIKTLGFLDFNGPLIFQCFKIFDTTVTFIVLVYRKKFLKVSKLIYIFRCMSKCSKQI